MHFQNPHPQGKLVKALCGEIYDVAVDIRTDSRYFRKWVGVRLSDINHKQLYIPEGYAHGFCVLSESALVSYKCTEFYDRDSEHCLRWDDPDLKIDWPVQHPNLSDKDRAGRTLAELTDYCLPFTDDSSRYKQV